MSENKNAVQNFETITPSELLPKIRKFKEEGYRFVQACGITGKNGAATVMYSFDKDYYLYNVKVPVADGESLESITGSYWNAFIYENEVHDLFGIDFLHSALDYGGNFFRISQETPWKSEKTADGEDAPAADADAEKKAKIEAARKRAAAAKAKKAAAGADAPAADEDAEKKAKIEAARKRAAEAKAKKKAAEEAAKEEKGGDE
jgi:ech hydrogenase subunit D